ncbi:MAG: ABC transporter ATP-binding protein [Alphaproteobacteria bacterium]
MPPPPAGVAGSTTTATDAAPAGPPLPEHASSGLLVRRLAADYLHPHRRRLVLAIACMVVVALATGAHAWLIQPALDDVLVAGNRRMLLLVPAAILLTALAKGICSYGQVVLMNTVSQRIIATIQSNLFGHLMRADLRFFHTHTTGLLIARLTNDTQFLREALTRAMSGMARDSLMVVALIGNMFWQSWQLSLASIFIFPLALAPIILIGRRMRRVSTSTQEQTGRLSALLNETFTGARHIKAYAMEAHEEDRARREIDGLAGLNLKAERVRARVRPLMEFIGSIAVALAIAYGGTLVLDGDMTAGQFTSFIVSLIMAYQPVRSLATLNTTLQQGLAAAERLFTLLDLRPEIVERSDAAPLQVTGGAIRFDHVRFAYGGDGDALTDFTLEVPSGATVALVGPSGAGKSTVLNLIPRFFDVQDGRVSIDGQDVRNVTQSSLRGAIGLVSQEVSLFDDTVAANIAYGRPGASQQDIMQAAEAAGAHSFITELPAGYDTSVGEHGVRLSGGQRQRVAIARAMLKNAPILLLDEATSALDTETERQVQTALKRLMAGRTTLVVAHRLTTIADADIIHVVEGGRVVESGSHDALVRSGGVYARLHALQSGGAGGRVPESRP